MGERETYAHFLRWIIDDMAGVTAEERRPAADDDTLVERLRALNGEVATAFATVQDSSFDLAAEPQTAWTTGDPPTGTRRDVIVQSIRHAGIHLGELRLTADLAVGETEAG
jgi:hypothetical protein